LQRGDESIQSQGQLRQRQSRSSRGTHECLCHISQAPPISAIAAKTNSMGLVWLPHLGWGLFGTAITVEIALATLLLHLVCGLTLGLLLARQTRRHAAQLHRDNAFR
jgi:hypothetical protein